jgi:hypothetical protein
LLFLSIAKVKCLLFLRQTIDNILIFFRVIVLVVFKVETKNIETIVTCTRKT